MFCRNCYEPIEMTMGRWVHQRGLGVKSVLCPGNDAKAEPVPVKRQPAQPRIQCGLAPFGLFDRAVRSLGRL